MSTKLITSAHLNSFITSQKKKLLIKPLLIFWKQNHLFWFKKLTKKNKVTTKRKPLDAEAHHCFSQMTPLWPMATNLNCFVSFRIFVYSLYESICSFSDDDVEGKDQSVTSAPATVPTIGRKSRKWFWTPVGVIHNIMIVWSLSHNLTEVGLSEQTLSPASFSVRYQTYARSEKLSKTYRPLIVVGPFR